MQQIATAKNDNYKNMKSEKIIRNCKQKIPKEMWNVNFNVI